MPITPRIRLRCSNTITLNTHGIAFSFIGSVVETGGGSTKILAGFRHSFHFVAAFVAIAIGALGTFHLATCCLKRKGDTKKLLASFDVPDSLL